MKLFLLKLKSEACYDAFIGGVVVAENEENAKKIELLGSNEYGHTYDKTWNDGDEFDTTYLGEAKEGLEEGHIILSSFKAG